MISIDKAAIIWSIVIVIIAVEITIFGNASDLEHHEDKTMNDVMQKELEKRIMMETSSISLQTDREIYTQNDKIKISGSVSKKLADMPITLAIINPNEDIITIAQVNVDNDRNFAETILIGGQLWEHEGKHIIKVHYGEKNTAKTSFNFIPDYEENIHVLTITERKTFCETHDGKWSDEFNNCIGGSMKVSCDDIDISKLTPPDVFLIITDDGACISHESFCKSMDGNSVCMSDKQKEHGRDICIAVCEFE